MNLPARRFQFVVGKDGVEGDENARVEAVRMLDQPRDVGDVVGRRSACAECRPADVHGIGAVIHRFDADVGIACGGEQFDLVGQHGNVQRG